MAHRIIFEGAELSGKSWVMSQIYNTLEPKYARSANILDGCYWFNCDLGFFGTKVAPKIMKNYLRIFKTLKEKNILVEKFHLANFVYSQINNISVRGFKTFEKKLKRQNFKIILLTFPEDEAVLAKRLQDRLNLYPNYKRIAKAPSEYIKQQTIYKQKIKESSLEYLIVEVDSFPSAKAISTIKDWLEEGGI